MLIRTINRSASIASQIVRAVALSAALAVAPAAHAVTLFWDQNGSLAGTGTWDVNTTANWNPTTTASDPNVVWNPNDGTLDASFGGNPGAGTAGSGLGGANGKVTVSGAVNVRTIILQTILGNYSLSGGSINIADPANSFIMQTNLGTGPLAQIIASPISGTDITVVANAAPGNQNTFLTLGAPGSGATNTFTGDLIFGGTVAAGGNGFNQININNPTALPSTATVKMRRTNSQLLFTAGGVSGTTAYTATFNNNIILNDTGSGPFGQSIGTSVATVTLGGVISGNASLTFQVGSGQGNGTIILANNSTYTGFTSFNSGAQQVLRLGIDNALPVGTTFIVNRGFAFDMAGFNQRVGGLTNTGANVAAITNTHATNLSTLTIDGNVNGTYPGNIGATGSPLFGNANIALVLAPTNTGRLTLSRTFGSDYTGGTTIGGGTLLAVNDSANSATGTGPVAVNSGGTLGGNGGVGAAGTGAITVASGGHLAPGLATGNTIGTLTALGNFSLGSGSSLDMGLGAPAPTGGTSDRVNLPSTSLTVPATAASIGVDLSDPAGGAAGNGTYTLMTFQAGQYTGSSNASQFFTSSLPSPNSLNGATITYQLADDSNVNQNGNPSAATRVNMLVSGGPNALVWTAAVDGTWNVGSPPSPFNFNNLGTGGGSAFANNDNVTFDDSGGNSTITVAGGGVQPNIVTINNSTITYGFSGGDIQGSSVGGGGGLFLGGTGPVTIDSNYTAAGPITSNKSGTGSATFNGAITAATSLTVNGGAVTLAGANTYPGDNTVNGGSLTASGASATFGTGDLKVNAGSAAIAAGVANAISNSATLTLLGGGTANMADAGFISLDSGINEQIAALVLGTTPQAAGTYGATGSGATNINDEYFSGPGIISVVVAGVPGDYNNNGVVDGADYVVWRNGGPLQNEVATLGSVTPEDYTEWRARFGNSGSGSILAGSSAVPEPSNLLFSLGMFISIVSVCRSKR
jgi:autotransporter-associated beta strand protein